MDVMKSMIIQLKTGYVGKIIPRGEFHDGQTMVNHFNFVARRMADNKLMLNFMNLQDLQVMEERIPLHCCRSCSWK
jgi:hypothetical protein